MASGTSSPCFPVQPTDPTDLPGFGFPLRHPHITSHGNYSPMFGQQTNESGHRFSALARRDLLTSRVGSPPPEKLCGRKRRAGSEDEEMMDHRSPSPPTDGTQSDRPVVPAKRFRTIAGPVQLPLPKLLEPLDRQQLVNLITHLAQKHPQLRPEITAQLPRPTIQAAKAALAAHERRLQQAFPYSRSGSGRDDYTFHRVRPVLVQLRDAIIQYAEHFVQPEEHSMTAFAYLQLASSVVERLPRWDNQEHEESFRGDLYRRLADKWAVAVTEAKKRASQGKIYGEQTVSEWYRSLERHNEQSAGGLTKVLDDFRSGLGWMIGVHPTIPVVDPAPSGHGLFSSSIY